MKNEKNSPLEREEYVWFSMFGSRFRLHNRWKHDLTGRILDKKPWMVRRSSTNQGIEYIFKVKMGNSEFYLFYTKRLTYTSFL